MKAYLVVTGSIFGLLGVAHLFRLVIEGRPPISADPWFLVENLVIFAIGAGVGVWALLLLRAAGRRPAF